MFKFPDEVCAIRFFSLWKLWSKMEKMNENNNNKFIVRNVRKTKTRRRFNRLGRRGGGGDGGDLTLTSRQVKWGTSPYVDVCGSANDPGPAMIPILDCKGSRSENGWWNSARVCLSGGGGGNKCQLSVKNVVYLSVVSKILCHMSVVN